MLVGLCTFSMYGMSWDENSQRIIGSLNWDYIFHNDKALLKYPDRDYGVAFELPLTFFEKVFSLSDTHSVHLMRHLVTHLFFICGAYACFKLTDLLYGNRVLSVFAFLLFLLHPHIYGHSFFNSKDVPFLSMFMICFYRCAKLLQQKTARNAVWLGICIGLLINMRIMGLMLLCCVLFFLVLDALLEKKFLSGIKLIAWTIVPSLLALYITWPFLWKDPVGNLLQAFHNMSHFRWNCTILFRGRHILASEVGWDYIPTWFCISTPVSYLLLGGFGMLAMLLQFLKNPLSWFRTLQGKSNLIFAGCFIAPVLAVILLKSVLYDGWRQLYFIYASFAMIMVFGLHILISRFKKAAVLLTGLALAAVVGIMVYLAPFPHVYFNAVVLSRQSSQPEYIRHHFEMDYWGTAFKQSLEYLLEKDTSQVIKVAPDYYPGELNTSFLKPELRTRIRLVDKEEATYFITCYRWHPDDYPFEDKKVHAIKVYGSSINAIYKLR